MLLSVLGCRRAGVDFGKKVDITRWVDAREAFGASAGLRVGGGYLRRPVLSTSLTLGRRTVLASIGMQLRRSFTIASTMME